jgi:hypothetical protein
VHAAPSSLFNLPSTWSFLFVSLPFTIMWKTVPQKWWKIICFAKLGRTFEKNLMQELIIRLEKFPDVSSHRVFSWEEQFV